MAKDKRLTYVVGLKLETIKNEGLESKRARAKALYDTFVIAMGSIKEKDPKLEISAWREQGWIPAIPIKVLASLRREVAALSMVKSIEYMGAPIHWSA